MTKRKGLGDLISVILITVLFLVILVLVVFSAVSYQRSVDIQDGNNNTRAVLSYVTTAVKSNAGSDIKLTQRDGMTVLSIEDDGYEQQIFFKDGKVLETFTVPDVSPSDADALEVGEAGMFEMSIEGELLTIRTDIGTSYVTIRSN